MENPEFWIRDRNGGAWLSSLKQIDERYNAQIFSKGNIDSYHFWFGILSGFPLCCVIWFCNTWNGREDKWQKDFEVEDFEKSIQLKKGRVLCPLCLQTELSKH